MFSNTIKPAWYDMENNFKIVESWNSNEIAAYQHSQLAFVPPLDYKIKSPTPLVYNEDLNSYYSECEEDEEDEKSEEDEQTEEDNYEDFYSDIKDFLPIKGSVFRNCNKMPIAKPLQSLIQKPVKVENRGRKPINKSIKKAKYNYNFKLTNEGKIITNKGLHFGRRPNHMLFDDAKHREQRRKYALKKQLLNGHY